VVIPLSGRVSGRASGPSRSRVDDGGGSRYVSGKSDRPLGVFSSRRIYWRRGGVRKWTRGAHPLVARPGLGPRHPRVWPAPGPLRLIFGLCLMSGKIGGSAFVSSNSEKFLCSFSETQKQQKTWNWHCGISLIG
jgi:hypothetical protein